MTRRLRVRLVFWITVVSGLITITTFVSEQSWKIDVRIPPGFWALLTAIGLFVIFELGQHYIDMMQVAYHRAHARRCRELLPRVRELRDLMKCAKGRSDLDPAVLADLQARAEDAGASLARLGVEFDFTQLEDYPILIDMLERRAVGEMMQRFPK